MEDPLSRMQAEDGEVDVEVDVEVGGSPPVRTRPGIRRGANAALSGPAPLLRALPVERLAYAGRMPQSTLSVARAYAFVRRRHHDF
jgi:hypothetical protein